MSDLIERLRTALAKWPHIAILEVMAEAADELARLRAEVDRLSADLLEAQRARERAYDNRDMALQVMEKAERERDELRRRIAEAPQKRVLTGQFAWIDASPEFLGAERVALVVLDAEEGK